MSASRSVVFKTGSQNHAENNSAQEACEPKVRNQNRFDLMLNGVLTSRMSQAVFGSEEQELQCLLARIAASQITENSTVEEVQNYRALLLRTGTFLDAQRKIRSELFSLALIDDLTETYNRRGFLILGTQLLRLARRSGQRPVLLFGDVDHLKRVNDEYGHEAGDALLVECAYALKSTFRESDIVARLGGDEFGVLAIETGSEYSEEFFLPRLHQNIARLKRSCNPPRLSISIGHARFRPDQPVPLVELLAEADRNMYEKKRIRSVGQRNNR